MSDDTRNGLRAEITTKPVVEVRPSRWTTTRLELWTYYLYYVGNNGLSGFNFGPSQFQNLLFLAGYDPITGPGTACGTNRCVLPYLRKIRDSKFYSWRIRRYKVNFCSQVNSIVLLTNGISFAIQTALLLFIGAWADYGRWRWSIVLLGKLKIKFTD